MNTQDIILKFNHLREIYGNLLIKLIKDKISYEEWHKSIADTFTDNELSFLFGLNIQKYTTPCTIDLVHGSRFEIKEDSSRLIISSHKAGLITWICTDGYMEISKRGYYIQIKDSDSSFLPYLRKLIISIYGQTKISFRKIKNKNCYQATICSKKIVSDLITYIPLSKSKNWTIPVEILDEKGMIETLRILVQTEGSVFVSNRTRAIEITLANFNVLIQAKYLFRIFSIPTTDIREDVSGGWKRYKLAILRRDNILRFRDIIGLVPETKKFQKLEKILKEYKSYHHLDCDKKILQLLKDHPLITTLNIEQSLNFHKTTIPKSLKRLEKIGKIAFKKHGDSKKFWYIKP
ncbi:MAG: LAGLIDADG family homing endonuclease [Candidatus Aenigmatarchaeota archaeon]